MFKKLAALCLLTVGLCFGQAQLCPDGSLKLFNPSCGEGAPPPRNIPADFRAVFGNPPDPNDFRNCSVNTPKAQSSNACFQQARDLYNQRLKQWLSSGGSFVPEGLDNEVVEFFHSFNMGTPVFYHTPLEDKARFPDARPFVHFEAPARITLASPGLVVALYQVQLILEGHPVENCHSFNERICSEE